MMPTTQLRFVKRRVGRNVVRILQQKWEDSLWNKEEWRDVELMEDGGATNAPFLPKPD